MHLEPRKIIKHAHSYLQISSYSFLLSPLFYALLVVVLIYFLVATKIPFSFLSLLSYLFIFFILLPYAPSLMHYFSLYFSSSTPTKRMLECSLSHFSFLFFSFLLNIPLHAYSFTIFILFLYLPLPHFMKWNFFIFLYLFFILVTCPC